MRNFILNHYRVKQYSCSKSCIKIGVYGDDEKVSVTKLYLQLPIKYLYYDIIKTPNLGGLAESRDIYGIIIIGDYKLRFFFTTNANKVKEKDRFEWM